jgi:hypothetical protein
VHLAADSPEYRNCQITGRKALGISIMAARPFHNISFHSAETTPLTV